MRLGILSVVFAATSLMARAEPDFMTSPIEPDWHVRASIYGWATGLDGEVTLTPKTAPVDTGFDEILENLDLALMGSLEIGRGRWGVAADVFFAELSADNSLGRLDYEVGLDQFIGNFAITRNVIDDFDTRMDVFLGARAVSIDTDLEIFRNGILRTRTFNGSASENWTDPILGARIHRELPCDFFLRCVGDIGGFGVSSDITWQALAGLGYHINDHAAVMLGYRGIGMDYEHGSFAYNVTNHGLLLQLEYTF